LRLRGALAGLVLIGAGLLPVTLLASAPIPKASSSVSVLETDYPELVDLAVHREWLTLLHYEVSPTGKIRNGYVNTDAFYFSENGRNSPADELHATIQAFSNPTASSSANNPLCQFPARRLWIEANSDLTFKEADCPEFAEWAQLDTARSISMLFATGHFSSPASFFGHNFLKINQDNGGSYLLDTAINFGALIPPNENPLTYLATGIFGGYEAVYSAEPFYRFLSKYGEEDLRDVWEYELALTKEQQVLLISHLWELKDMQFPYFFFRENCAYHISALLNLFTTAEYVPKYMPWAMPITVFDGMMTAEIDGKPLIANIELHRSRRTLFQDRFAQSPPKIKRLIHLHALGDVDFDKTEGYKALSEDEKIWLIDTLLDYSTFMSKEKGGDVHKEVQRQLLLQRLSLKQGEIEASLIDKSNPPHLGQKPGYAAIGITSRHQASGMGFVRIRPAYYDFLGIEAGRKPHALFTLFDTQLNFDDEDVSGRIDIFSLSNLNTQYSGIALDKASSWQLRLSNEPNSDKCNDCNAWLLQWDIGKAKKLGDNMAIFALGGIQLNESRNRSANGSLQTHIGITGKVTTNWRMYARATYTESFNTFQPFHTSYEFENRFGSSRWWDVRLKVRSRDETDVSLSAALYW